MTGTQQIPLDLGHREAFARDDFFVSSSNQDAIAWLDKWPDWPAPALVIAGPAGCGKTHLCHVLQKRAGDKVHVIDDADRLMGDAKREEEIFHLYNRLSGEGGHMLLTGLTRPRDWKFALPDLKSRMLAAPLAEVGMPDDALMAVVLAKMFSDRQVFVPQEVVQFITTRIERSFAALRHLVDDIDRKAMAEKRAVTVPLVRDLMQEKLKF